MSPFASTTSDPRCAVRSDGTLKEPSEISWTYDADEDIPFPSGSTSGAPAPALVVAGIRRTTRIGRPSKRALEAAEASSHPATKRKASTDLNSDRHVARRVIIDLDSDNDNDANGDNGDGDGNGDDNATSDFDGLTDLATEPADDYEVLEAMADADNRVCIFFGSELFSHSLLRLSLPGPVTRALMTYALSSVTIRSMYIQLQELL
jgi:hypothetical protein